MPAPMEGKAALVTGGGSGIGLAAARHLLRDGCSVTLMGRTVSRLEEAAADLESEERPDSARVHWHAGDVSAEESVREAVVAACDAHGGLDVAVAAAGIGTLGPILLMSRDQWQSVLDVNLTGTFLTMKHAGTAIARRGGGAIVAVSSVASSVTHRFMSAYCVSKVAIDALVRNAADELGVANIRVNSVRPSIVPTDLATPLMDDDQVREDYLTQMPIARVGTVDDIGAAIRYLAGPESSWVTGVNLQVDGGHHLRRGPNLEPWARTIFGDDAAEGRV